MIGAVVVAAALSANVFAYDARASRVTYGSVQHRLGSVVQSVTIAAGSRVVSGELVRGAGNAPHPAVLFVHWLGDPPTTNHTEFERDAFVVAKKGVTSLLVDATWSKSGWFDKVRKPSTDYADSIAQVIDLRRALDVLLAQPGVDATRVAYVGHDFGSMYGAVLAGVDNRPQWYVLMAGTTTFSEWFLLGTQPGDVPAYVAQMAPLDPLPYLARSHARGYYFQFSAHDHYITPAHELAFFSAAPLPRAMALYDIDHSLATPAAFSDRLAWLEEKLSL